MSNACFRLSPRRNEYYNSHLVRAEDKHRPSEGNGPVTTRQATPEEMAWMQSLPAPNQKKKQSHLFNFSKKPR